jgi:hypothetical protein
MFDITILLKSIGLNLNRLQVNLIYFYLSFIANFNLLIFQFNEKNIVL